MMDHRSRQATTADISLALVKLFSVLPRRNGTDDDDDAALAGYELALQGVDYQALGETIGAIIRGEIEGMSTRYCPTPPELSKAVRDQMRRDRQVSDVPALGYRPTPFKSIQMRMDATREAMTREGRKLLCSVSSHAAAQEMIRRGGLPSGSIYSGLLGEFYGPIQQQQPEGTDHVRERTIPDVAARYGPTVGEPATGLSAGPDQIGEPPDSGREFGPEQPTDEQTDDGEAPGTFDSDRGFAGLDTAAE